MGGSRAASAGVHELDALNAIKARTDASSIGFSTRTVQCDVPSSTKGQLQRHRRFARQQWLVPRTSTSPCYCNRLGVITGSVLEPDGSPAEG
jgi:hypothetical protein